MNGNLFAASDGKGGQVRVGGGINHEAVNTAVGKGLAAQVEKSRVQVEKVWKIKIPRLGRSGRRRFRPDSMHTGRGESEMSGQFFPAITFNLGRFDWTKSVRVGDGTIIDIEFPQHTSQADRPPGTLKLKAIRRRF